MQVSFWFLILRNVISQERQRNTGDNSVIESVSLVEESVNFVVLDLVSNKKTIGNIKKSNANLDTLGHNLKRGHARHAKR